MIIGIDASNIRTGGGKKHIEKFISNSLKEHNNIKFILVSNSKLNSSFVNTKRVKCISNFLLNINGVVSLLSQYFFSKYYFKSNNCDIVFVPGGIFLSNFKPFISMSQNMLPFDKLEINKFRFLKRIKFSLMKFLQANTFKRSEGVIFLTEYAKNTILDQIGNVKSSIVIPHGIKQQFKNKYLKSFDTFEILYISDFLPYKNQYTVTQSVVELIREGHNINLTLIGRRDKSQLNLIERTLNRNKDIRSRIKIKGMLNYTEIKQYLENCSLFLFASSCENLPFILLEAISYGLPVITTNKSPMKDMVFGKNVLFESSDVNSLKNTIIANLNYEKLKGMSKYNFLNSKKYTWESNVKDSISYLKSFI